MKRGLTTAMRLYWRARMRAALCMQVSRDRVNHSSTHFTCSFHMRRASPLCRSSWGAREAMGTACTCKTPPPLSHPLELACWSAKSQHVQAQSVVSGLGFLEDSLPHQWHRTPCAPFALIQCSIMTGCACLCHCWVMLGNTRTEEAPKYSACRVWLLA